MNPLDGRLVVPFEELRMTDVDSVGGKNSSLGEMISQLTATGVRVPGGFATTAHAFREFLQTMINYRISKRLEGLNIEDVRALAECGAQIRGWIVESPLSPALEAAVRTSYAALLAESGSEISVAVRSSATAEDLPDASFAGQQETYLNVSGIDQCWTASNMCLRRSTTTAPFLIAFTKASLTRKLRCRRAFSAWCAVIWGCRCHVYAGHRIRLSDVVFITSSYGLGETVVQGAVNPDEFYVHKPMLRSWQIPDHSPSNGQQTDQDDVCRRRQLSGRKARSGAPSDAGHAGRAAQSLFVERCRHHRVVALCGHHREALWPADGYRMGPGRP